MRVLIVSAHYPPNFVSGGTLVPARLAAGLAARGHEVQVFAGHLDAELPPLAQWTARGDDDVAVHHVVTTPWTGWDDTRNHDNPPVTEAFTEVLDRFAPDVVHAHSLQSLGAGLLTAAQAAGVPVALTMHDFWWTCARQFLVDRAMTPCSLVVGCGVCECHAGRPALNARDAVLRRALQAADVVVAPSHTAGRVFAAEVVEPDRLVVDENGIPGGDDDPAAPPVPAAPGEGVRLLFAGGPDPLKGWPVLAAAVPHLPADVPWTLDVYGVDSEKPLAAGRHPRDPRVRYHPPFTPSERAAVMARADVLVLASVMRESHSIITREALRAGLAVVTGDTLGPEEVVTDRGNGLVVPAGDPLALAAALVELVADPGLVARLRAAPRPTAIRSVAEQVASTETLLQDLVDRGPRPPARVQWPTRPVVFVVGIDRAPLRYRARLPAEALQAHGVATEVRHYRDPELPSLLEDADAVVVYRVPATVQVLDLLDRTRDRGVPVLYDVDDLIVDPGLRGQLPGLAALPPAELDLWWHGVARYRTTLEHCDAYVGSTAMLVARIGELTGLPAYRFANGVGTLLGRASDRELRRPRAPGPLRVGYFSGTTTHDHDWASVEPAVIEVLLARPDVELWLGGHIRPTPALAVLGDRVRQLPPVPWYELPALLRDVDVNLAPLELGGVFNEAKSAIKWLEAALVGTPTVASPSQPFAEVVRPGENGELPTDHDGWVTALGGLLDDPLRRARTGTRARRDALLELSPWRQGRVYLDILTAVRDHVAGGGARRSEDASRAPWTDVADDEPWADAFGQPPVEPYEAPQPGAPRPDAAALARAAVDRGRAGARAFVRLRAEVGTGPAVDRAVRSAGRRGFRIARRGAGVVRQRVRRG